MIKFIFWSSVLSVVYSCGDNKKVIDPAESYLPVMIGNTWIYEETGGAVQGTVTKTILETETYQNQSSYIQETTQTNSTITKRSNWIVKDNGDIYRMRQQRFSQPGLLLNYREYEPGFLRLRQELQKAGDNFYEQHVRKEFDSTGTLLRQKTKLYTWTVESIDDEVVVPAGSFSCLRVKRIDSDSGEKTYWYAKGVGKVQEKDILEEERLQSYSLAKP